MKVFEDLSLKAVTFTELHLYTIPLATLTTYFEQTGQNIYLCSPPDVDECSADSSPCDENADCTNSDGSYSCTCKQGFTGDGKTCQGMR